MMKPVAVLYSRSIAAMLQRGEDARQLLDYYRIIVSEKVWHQIHMLLEPDLADAIASRCLLYFDHWGKSIFSSEGRPWECWQKPPGDRGFPGTAFYPKKPIYAYPQHIAYVAYGVGMEVGRAMLVTHKQAAGVFMDDWGYHRNWWKPGADTAEGVKLRDSAWRLYDHLPTWRDGSNWNKKRMDKLEFICHAWAALRRKDVVLNANSFRRNVVGRSGIFFESVGPVGADWADYWVDIKDISEDLRPHDILWMKCLDAKGNFHPGCLDTWNAMKKAADRVGCGIGRGFYERPSDEHNGGSKQSNTESPTSSDWKVENAVATGPGLAAGHDLAGADG